MRFCSAFAAASVVRLHPWHAGAMTPTMQKSYYFQIQYGGLSCTTVKLLLRKVTMRKFVIISLAYEWHVGPYATDTPHTL